MLSNISVFLPVVILCFPTISMGINVDGCNISSSSSNAVGTPYFEDQLSNSVYSCLSSRSNDNYDVHVIGVYEGGQRAFRYHPTSTSNVCMNINNSFTNKPLVLVLTTYEPIQWVLHIPEGVVISKVILCSYQNSSVTFPGAQVLQVERGPRYFGYGSDSGGGSTERLLQYLSSTYGPVSSFTGTYRANKWTLSISGRLTNTSKRQESLTCDTTVNVDGCSVISNNPSAVGKPIFGFSRYPIYSCLSTKNNSNYSIHVISVHEAGWFHSLVSPQSRNSNVILDETMSNSDKPLVLVFTTFAPIQWIIHIPERVTVNKVILCSYYSSSVIFTRGQELQVEMGPPIYGYGSDTGRTERLLQYISSSMGPVTSFTGTYEANQWTLSIDRTISSISTIQGSIQTAISTEEDHTITTTEDIRKGDSTSAIQKYNYTISETDYRQIGHNITSTEYLKIPQQQNILIISMAVIIALLSVFACSMTMIFIVVFYRRNGKKVNVKDIIQDPLYEEIIKVTEDKFNIRENQCYGSRLTELVPKKNIAYETVSIPL